jgi:[ribosomal protein S5]-alanine N-acetyltransferase
MIVLETERLRLREFLPGDTDALAAVISDPETMRFYPKPFDRAGVESWIERNQQRYRNDGHGLWAMVLKASGELVGDCGLSRQIVDGLDEIEIGYHVRRDLWGWGYAPEAAAACRYYGFERLATERLIALIRPENLPSQRVAEKIGLNWWKTVTWRDLSHHVYAIRRK